LLLLGLSRVTGQSGAIGVYVLLTCVQWMSGAGIFSLLMDRTPQQNRSYAAALHNVVNLAGQASSAALAGKAFERFGYSSPLALNAGFAVLAAALLFFLLREKGPLPRAAQLQTSDSAVDAFLGN
jgi:predicted MFS family arabinose efflux permease